MRSGYSPVLSAYIVGDVLQRHAFCAFLASLLAASLLLPTYVATKHTCILCIVADVEDDGAAVTAVDEDNDVFAVLAFRSPSPCPQLAFCLCACACNL